MTAVSKPPTAEQLRLAFRHVSRPGWPATLEAALAHPVYSVCLTAMARQLNRHAFNHQPPPQPVAPTPAAAPVSPGIRRRDNTFDGKCAAANDRSNFDE